jgi:hypothetical protein
MMSDTIRFWLFGARVRIVMVMMLVVLLTIERMAASHHLPSILLRGASVRNLYHVRVAFTTSVLLVVMTVSYVDIYVRVENS